MNHQSVYYFLSIVELCDMMIHSLDVVSCYHDLDVNMILNWISQFLHMMVLTTTSSDLFLFWFVLSHFFMYFLRFRALTSMGVVGYFFVVLGKLFAYSLGYFLQSHIEDNSSHLLPYKLWSWRSSVPLVQIVSLGQQKSSP